MAETEIKKHSFPNGLVLVAESLPEVRAASFQLLLPAGVVTEDPGQAGISGMLENMCYRGAGPRDAREVSDALDELGVQRGGGPDLESTNFGGTMLADDLKQSLALYSDIIRRPTLPADQVESARQLAFQRLDSVKDNPTQKLFIELSAVYFPGPYGRSTLGTPEGLSAITADSLRKDHASRYVPRGAVLAVAGRFDWDTLVENTALLFGDWSGSAPEPPAPNPGQRERYRHIGEDSAQEQIGVAWPEAPADHAGYYAARVAVQVLSGGMGARLFTEVREKRGLVYSVFAAARSVRGAGMVIAYAGTTPERRQECLDVLLGELKRLPEGVTEEELARARTGLLSSLVMQGESCSARAGAIARDELILGRVRSLAEVRAAIEAVTTQTIREHLSEFPPRDFSVVTLGPEPVVVNQ